MAARETRKATRLLQVDLEGLVADWELSDKYLAERQLRTHLPVSLVRDWERVGKELVQALRTCDTALAELEAAR